MIVTDLTQLSAVVDHFRRQDSFCFDVETTGGEYRGNPRRNRVSWLSMATHGLGVSIPLGFPHGEFIRLEFPLTPTGEKRVAEGKRPLKSSYSTDNRKATKIWGPAPPHLHFDGQVKAILEPLLFSDQLKIGHNLKFDIESLGKHFGGAVIPPPYADTMVAAFILDVRHKGRLGLDHCVGRELDYQLTKGVGKDIVQHSFSEVAKYGFLDARSDWFLWQTYREKLACAGMNNLFKLEMDVLDVVIGMEMTGAPVDENVLRLLGKEWAAKLEDIDSDIYRLAGRAFNIDSNQELQQVLFAPKEDGGLGLRSRRLTPGGKKKQDAGQLTTIKDYSVDAKSLQSLRHRIAAQLIAHNHYGKLIDAFVTPYIGGIVERTTNGKTVSTVRESLLINGRIHASFNQTGTVDGRGAETGRFSSSNPNLQQCPSRTEDGRKIRSAFAAPAGHKLVVADYSQIEPRIIADMSGDPRMVETYLNGGDVYLTLAEPFGLERKDGKTLVLAVSYGVGPDTIASNLGIKLRDAKRLIYTDFPRQFPAIDRLKKRTIQAAKRRRPIYVQTLIGRRRYLPELMSRDEGLRRRAERQAFNTLIQGSAADINKIGLVRSQRLIPEGAAPILTVHDEVVVLTPERLADETAAAVREGMEGVGLLTRIPLVADVKIVDNWSQAK